jgi:hypothetical protein
MTPDDNVSVSVIIMVVPAAMQASVMPIELGCCSER